MTDARLPERWLNDRRIAGLSDRAFRRFVTVLMWSVANRTDGQLGLQDLALMPAASREVDQEIIDAGLWDYERGLGGERWQITDFEETQTSSGDLEKLRQMRRNARDRQRKHRDVSRDSHGDMSRDVTRDATRTGQARPGSLLTEGQGQDRSDEKEQPVPAPESGAGSNSGGTSSATPPNGRTSSQQGDDRYAREGKSQCAECGNWFASRYGVFSAHMHNGRRPQSVELAAVEPAEVVSLPQLRDRDTWDDAYRELYGDES